MDPKIGQTKQAMHQHPSSSHLARANRQRAHVRAKEEEKSLSLDTPADVPMTPFTRMFWSSTACRKPEWLAKARNPLESTTSASSATGKLPSMDAPPEAEAEAEAEAAPPLPLPPPRGLSTSSIADRFVALASLSPAARVCPPGRTPHHPSTHWHRTIAMAFLTLSSQIVSLLYYHSRWWCTVHCRDEGHGGVQGQGPRRGGG